jgi:hypothetical protein
VEAGFDVTLRHDAAVSHYSESDEQQAVTDKPGKLFCRLSDELRNEPIRD